MIEINFINYIEDYYKQGINKEKTFKFEIKISHEDYQFLLNNSYEYMLQSLKKIKDQIIKDGNNLLKRAIITDCVVYLKMDVNSKKIIIELKTKIR